MAFDDTWKTLQANISAGTVIPNWTVHSGAVGEPFTISDVSLTAILVDAPGAATPQRVSQADSEAIYERWDEYTRKAMLRSDYSPLTRHSKYVISIFHWLETRISGSLP